MSAHAGSPNRPLSPLRENPEPQQPQVDKQDERRSRSPSRKSDRSQGKYSRSPRRDSPGRGGSPYRDERENKVESFQVYVGGIARDVEPRDLKELFGAAGRPIHDVIMKGRYAFVEFSSLKDAEAAIAETNGISFHNYKLVVEMSSKQTHLIFRAQRRARRQTFRTSVERLMLEVWQDRTLGQ
jgi:RNA recognition motif-containing protein